MQFISFPEQNNFTERLANQMNAGIIQWVWRHFPDGESYVRILEDVKGQDIVVMCSLNKPDSKIFPLILLADALKSLGAKSVKLVSPYLCYMRQDAIFNEGEALSIKIFGNMISKYFDGIVTFDSHLHRYKNLEDIFNISCTLCHAMESIAKWIKKNIPKPAIIGPDGESIDIVKVVADSIGAPYVVLHKTRLGDRDVSVNGQSIDHLEGFTPVIVDDIISSACTMVKTVSYVKKLGSPVCVGVHGVFAPMAYENLIEAGALSVVTTSTIPHFSNKIDIIPVLIEALS